jgi:hypothetical protein
MVWCHQAGPEFLVREHQLDCFLSYKTPADTNAIQNMHNARAWQMWVLPDRDISQGWVGDAAPARRQDTTRLGNLHRRLVDAMLPVPS